MNEVLAKLTIRQKFYLLMLFIVVGFGIFGWQAIVGNAWKYTSKLLTARIEFGMLHQNENFVSDIRSEGKVNNGATFYFTIP